MTSIEGGDRIGENVDPEILMNDEDVTKRKACRPMLTTIKALQVGLVAYPGMLCEVKKTRLEVLPTDESNRAL